MKDAYVMTFMIWNWKWFENWNHKSENWGARNIVLSSEKIRLFCKCHVVVIASLWNRVNYRNIILMHNRETQWSKTWIIFQRGECPKFAHFPSETYVLMLKYQKLAKSVGGNWGFWINFDFENFRTHFGG